MVCDQQHRLTAGNFPVDLELEAEQPADLPVIPVRKAPRPRGRYPQQHGLNGHQRHRQREKSGQDGYGSERSHGVQPVRTAPRFLT